MDPKTSVKPSVGKPSSYLPHRGFVGTRALEVPNYLFGTFSGVAKGYEHCRELADFISHRPVKEQYLNSMALTDFLRKREMTFSKLTRSGEYKIFSVPCTTTPLPLPKSLFNALEKSTQGLVASLRFLLQEIYSSESVAASGFVQSLPKGLRAQFVRAVEECPQYFPQLHHPVMKDYPFFDVVGLDLVLKEDCSSLMKSGAFSGKNPFSLLELNAGSPSGASNNQYILDGLSKIDPHMLSFVGKVMPNDHFKVLADTYRSLGEAWTGQTEGVQIVLPPGGTSGAAPEIHQLAALSGLIYADAGQLYQGADGFVRLRTVSGRNPVVTAIYSRVNADSALFDKEKKVHLRDAEDGKPLYWVDDLRSAQLGRTVYRKDETGKNIPLESQHSVPNAIQAIHERKLYVGGLNRVLDNKIILATLCEYAGKYFKKNLEAIGLANEASALAPPETLPSTKESVLAIEKNPEDWVIKSPNLSGGKGVYILKTLSAADRRKIIAKAKKQPAHYAYQKLVRIGRLPVAMKDKRGKIRLGNLAADLRMWMFFGAGPSFSVPRLTHNALVRMAPHERGPLSSIVNTSMGGGYAPMVVADDTNHPEAVAVAELVKTKEPKTRLSDVPSFVGAQIVQAAEIAHGLQKYLADHPEADAYRAYVLANNLKKQCREILSYLHARNMEPLNEAIEILERKVDKKRIGRFYRVYNQARIQLATLLESVEHELSPRFYDLLDELRALSVEPYEFTLRDKRHDKLIVDSLKRQTAHFEPRTRRAFARLLQILCGNYYPRRTLPEQQHKLVASLVAHFLRLAEIKLSTQESDREFATLFAQDSARGELRYEGLFLRTDSKHLVATEEEYRRGELIVNTDFVPEQLRKARAAWREVLHSAECVPEHLRERYLARQREWHFQDFPMLRRYQDLIDKEGPSSLNDMIELLDVFPYAKWNLVQFAKQQDLSIEEIFQSTLQEKRISLLSNQQAGAVGGAAFAGECFVRKRHKHGMLSDSQVLLWINKDIKSYVQAYTVGHEIIHFHQIHEMLSAEKSAVRSGPLAFAGFLNFFGNFLGMSTGSSEEDNSLVSLDDRLPVYGFAELQDLQKKGCWVSELGGSVLKGAKAWDKQARRFGSALGYSTSIVAPIKVKALREVIPALENAKNIRFAKDLGLVLPVNEIQSALPVANVAQIQRYRGVVERAIYSSAIDWEALRVIASHQYFGVRFARQERAEEALMLKGSMQTIALGGTYNQTQQQQQQ